MGTDIFMHLVKDGKYVEKDIYEWRDSDWFGNLQNNGWDEIYDYFPADYGLSPQAPSDLSEKHLESCCYYGFRHISVKDFKDWFVKYHPEVHAGWFTTYDKWLYERKNILKEDSIKWDLDKDDNIHDYHFMEYIDENDQSLWLYNYLIKNNIEDNVDITYYFG